MKLPGWRSAAEFAGAGLAVWAVHQLLPLPADDPFRTSLVILPLVVAALRALGRHGPCLPGARNDPGGQLEAAALSFLLFLTLIHKYR